MPGGSGHRGTSCRGTGPWRMLYCGDGGTVEISGEDGQGMRRPWKLHREDRGTVGDFVGCRGTVGELPWNR